MAQNGLWDVDGTGMRKIEDPNLAQAFVEKTNSLNFDTAQIALLWSAAFALLPQSVTYPLSIFTIIFGALYYFDIPDNTAE